MKNKSKLLLILSMSFLCFQIGIAQGCLPQGIDGTFESCLNVAGTTDFNHNVTCGGWQNGFGSADTWANSPSSPFGSFLNSNLNLSPDGGVYAGAIWTANSQESFFATITNLTVGENYTITFYQAPATNKTQEIPTSLRWKVTFGSQTQFSPDRFIEDIPQWTQVNLSFVANNPTQELSFVPALGSSTLNTGYSHMYMVIDGISIQGPDCGTVTEPQACECSSFSPIGNRKYVLSTWVREEITNFTPNTPEELLETQPISYTYPKVAVNFYDQSDNPIGSAQVFGTTGKIIEGWQRIVGEFVVPSGAVDISIDLINNNPDSNVKSFFDDVRVHPYHGNMKSFVYDNQNYRLMAELDENNYATYYEYDQEGGLVRVKKETERGVMTIQETRSGTTISN
ncbi:hypothetical protein [Winogradskyella sp.]|uniref:hypothetical protein n=1 Tax=Winogradskyella sp. TaxID=1883156 RepID=UPI003BA9F5A2